MSRCRVAWRRSASGSKQRVDPAKIGVEIEARISLGLVIVDDGKAGDLGGMSWAWFKPDFDGDAMIHLNEGSKPCIDDRLHALPQRHGKPELSACAQCCHSFFAKRYSALGNVGIRRSPSNMVFQPIWS